MEIPQLYASKIQVSAKNCWLWQGLKSSDGYAIKQIRLADGRWRARRVHRLIYELLVSKIPDDLVSDHLCRVRHCVNPEHIQIVTVRENNLRGNSVSGMNYRKTECIRGHRFTDENTYIWATGKRACKKCTSLLNKRKWDKIRARTA